MDVSAIEHRFTNHAPVGDTGAVLDEVTRRMIDLGTWIAENVPDGREQSLAITHLEECSMWTKAGIARNQSEVSTS